MGDDEQKKLPAPKEGRALDAPRTQYVASPARRGIFAGLWSRFMATLNGRTIKANSEEVRAMQEYAGERGRLADVMLDADRRIATYLYDRDDLIADDRAEHRARMEKAELNRELDRQVREDSRAAMQLELRKAEKQRGYDEKLADEANAAALAEAEWRTARARWGRDAFEQSLPIRKERIEHLYKTGALDAEIERLISEGGRDQQRRDNAGQKPAAAAPDANSVAVLEQLLAEIDQDIELAHATLAGDEHKAALYAMRARINARLAAAKAAQDSGA